MPSVRRLLVLGALVVPLVVATLGAQTAAAAPAPIPPRGDIAGFTASPASGHVIQASVNVTVPTAVTSADCNTPGTFEYAEFGLRFSSNTFARVDATCGNTGNIAYFCDIESGGTLKIVVLQAGQRVRLSMSVNGSVTTISMSRGATFRKVTGTPGPFSSVGIGGWYEPGFDIPVLTTTSKFTGTSVNNTALMSVPATETSLTNGTHVIMSATSLTGTGSFNVRYLRQS